MRFPARYWSWTPRRAAKLLILVFAGVPAIWCSTPALGQSAGEDTPKLESSFEDFLHFARLGRFDEAKAFGETVLTHDDLTPVKLLEIADKDPNAVPTLITLINHTSISDTAQRVLNVIREGEYQRRKNPDRIQQNIEALGMSPQAEFSAVQRLRESGENAIPQMIATLKDQNQKQLWPPIIRALPRMGQQAVIPLAIALNVEDAHVRRHLISALGDLGYPQAAPFLMEILSKKDAPPEIRQAAEEALRKLGSFSERPLEGSAVSGFIALGEQFYNEHGSVKADPRLESANVWYWDSEALRSVQVPTEIFGPVMAMRSAQWALALEPDAREAIALWLAADIRREARLGMDVESGEPADGDTADETRPEDFPRSVYFAQAAGPQYCHLVLGRALNDHDKAVALGALAALRDVAGAASLVGSEGYKQPLVAALEYPDTEVRTKAAIALARSLPQTPFRGVDRIGNVLAEAITYRGGASYLVVDPDQDKRNRVMEALRGEGAEVVADENFFAGLDRARTELDGLNGVFLASDLTQPNVTRAVESLRSDYRYAKTPVVLLVKDGEDYRVDPANEQFELTAKVEANAGDGAFMGELEALLAESHGEAMTSDEARELALDATEAIGLLALRGRSSVDISPTLAALVRVAQDNEEEESLRTAAAGVLALMSAPQAQQAVAQVALAEESSEDLRLAGFKELSESAQRFGNLLGEDLVNQVVAAASDTPDLVMRTAASQALGALNLATNQASEIIRKYNRDQ